MKFSCIKKIVLLSLVILSFKTMAREHLIFSVVEDLPMGDEGEVLRRNYYVNIGANQGVDQGTVLSVYRVVSKMNPYDNKKRMNYKIPIGELEVLHTEDEAAVAKIKKLYLTAKDPIFEINNFMIGDHVTVHVE